MKEKRFILINRIIFLVLLLINIALPIILSNTQPELELLVLTEDVVSTSGGTNYSFGDDLNSDDGVISWWS